MTRDRFDILYSAWCRSENLGTTLNEHLAHFLVSRICLSHKTFIDIGAHVGSIIAAVLHYAPSVKVIAIEAVPERASRLQKKYPAIVVYQCAAGEREGKTSFFVRSRETARSTLSSNCGADADAAEEMQLEMRTLDRLIESPDVDAIKIDVVGAELGVLRGARELLSKCRPTVMFESGPREHLGYTKDAIWQFLNDLDYSIVVPNLVAHNDSGLSLEGFIESHRYPQRTINYFAIPVERRTELRDRARQLLLIS